MSSAQLDELCGLVRTKTNASSAIVIVLRGKPRLDYTGKRGSDYAVCTEDGIAPTFVPELPAILRDLANQIDLAQQQGEPRHVSRR